MRIIQAAVLTVVTLINVVNVFAVPGDENWVSMGQPPVMSSGAVNAVARDGNNFYFGGSFTSAGAVPAVSLARWDGKNWFDVGTGPAGSGITGSIHALAVGPDGRLYAAGVFTKIGGINANRIAVWDGTSWSPLDSGLDDAVYALAFDANNNLIAGGIFTTAGGVSSNSVAMWDGSAWIAMPGLSSGEYIASLRLDSQGNIYAGGIAISKWDGSGWTYIGSPNGTIFSIAIDENDDVYVGGSFTRITVFDPELIDVAANRIAKWDGSSWSALSTGTNNTINSLIIDGNNTLWAGGIFTSAGGNSTGSLAAWNGSVWMGGYSPELSITSMVPDGFGNLVVSGSYSGTAVAKQYINGAWLHLGYGLNNEVSSIVEHDGKVYVGGLFTRAGNEMASHVAVWNEGVWQKLGDGMNGVVHTLVVDAFGAVYAGGSFTQSGEVSGLNRIAKWNGASWEPLGGGFDADVWSIVIEPSTNNIYAGGSFSSAGGLPASRIARWDGSAWHPVGSGVTGGGITSMVMDKNGQLYAGGSFTSAGGVFANRIARWDGNQWSALSAGLNNTVNALAVDNLGAVYAGGSFTMSDATALNRIAKWEGGVWSGLGGGASGSVAVTELTTDKNNNLYAAGSFVTIGGISANRIARWNGVGWSALGQGTDAGANSVHMGDSGNIYVGGVFKKAGGKASGYVARWSVADSDGDGFNDSLDVFISDPLEWLDTDADTIGNNADWDDDGDDVPDVVDSDPLNPAVATELSLPLDAPYRGILMKQGAAQQ